MFPMEKYYTATGKERQLMEHSFPAWFRASSFVPQGSQLPGECYFPLGAKTKKIKKINNNNNNKNPCNSSHDPGLGHTRLWPPLSSLFGFHSSAATSLTSESWRALISGAGKLIPVNCCALSSLLRRRPLSEANLDNPAKSTIPTSSLCSLSLLSLQCIVSWFITYILKFCFCC